MGIIWWVLCCIFDCSTKMSALACNPCYDNSARLFNQRFPKTLVWVKMCIAHRLLHSTSEISDATASMTSPGYFALQHRVAPPRKAYSLTRRLSSHSAHSTNFPFSNRFLGKRWINSLAEPLRHRAQVKVNVLVEQTKIQHKTHQIIPITHGKCP